MMTLALLLAMQAAPEPTPTPTPKPLPAAVRLSQQKSKVPPSQRGSLAAAAARIRLQFPGDEPGVITNETVRELSEGVTLTVASPEAAEAGEGAGDSEVVVRPDATMTRWQGRYQRARGHLAFLEERVHELEVAVADLERQFYAEDDPARRDGTIKPEWDRSLLELRQRRTELEEAGELPEMVIDAARRDGAVPGWFRGLDEPAPAPATELLEELRDLDEQPPDEP